MSDQVDLDSKTQQASEEESIIPPGEGILAQLGIDSNTVKTMKPGIKRSYYRAVINWMMKYKANSDASNLEKVKGLLEAFYHLCEVEDWDKAGKIIFMTLKTPTSEELHNQMQTWGYSQEVINIYNNLLGKLSPKEDTIFYNGLGNVYLDLEDFHKATSHYLNSHEIAIKFNNPKGRRIALAGLGDVQMALGHYQIAREYYNKQLELAREIGERLGEGDALGRIGNAYYLLNNFKTALDYHQRSLKIALVIGDKHGEARTLGNIGITYHSLQEYKLAANYHCQYLQLSCDIGLKRGEGEALINWSITHRELKEYSEALEKLHQALTIFQSIQREHSSLELSINTQTR